MKIEFDSVVFESKNEHGILLKLRKYVNSKYGSLEQYFNGNKCAFSDNYSKCAFRIEKDKCYVVYKHAPFYCGKCQCKALNHASKEYLMKCKGLSENDTEAFLREKGKKAIKTSLADPNSKNPAILAIRGFNPQSRNELLKKFDGDAEKVNTHLSNKAKKSIDAKIESGWFDDVSNNPFSKEFWKKKGLSDDEAQVKVNSRNFWCKESELGTENPGRLKYWTDKFGLEKGTKIFYENRRLWGYYATLEGMIEKYGNERAKREFYERYSKSGLHSSGPHSKPSKVFFLRLYKKLRRHGFQRSDMSFGAKGSNEYTIRDAGISEFNRYDFCLIPKKMIIEYNGSIWHPRKERMSKEKYNAWRMPWHPDITAEMKESKDLAKIKFAADRGYDIIEVWDTDDVEQALTNCFKRIIS